MVVGIVGARGGMMEVEVAAAMGVLATAAAATVVRHSKYRVAAVEGWAESPCPGSVLVSYHEEF